MDYIQMLDLEDSLAQTSESQKAANEHRRRLFHLLNREKDETATLVTTDFVMMRLEFPGILLSPNTFLQK
jgi:hypothetical protein